MLQQVGSVTVVEYEYQYYKYNIFIEGFIHCENDLVEPYCKGVDIFRLIHQLL